MGCFLFGRNNMGGRGATSATGRGGSGGSMEQEQNATQSMDDVARKARDSGIYILDSVREWDVKSIKTAVDGIAAVLQEFPEIENYIALNGITVKLGSSERDGYASASFSGEINLNAGYWKNGLGYLNDSYKNDVSHNFHPQGTTGANVTSHEAGHLVNLALIMLKYPDEGNYSLYQQARDWNNGATANKIVSEACKRVKRTEYGKGKTNNDLVREVSGYAIQSKRNRSEAIAECIADFVANRGNANPLSIAVRDVIKEEFRKGRS